MNLLIDKILRGRDAINVKNARNVQAVLHVLLELARLSQRYLFFYDLSYRLHFILELYIHFKGPTTIIKLVLEY